MLDDRTANHRAERRLVASRSGLAAGLLMAAGLARALGIGSYEVQSSLGEPLRLVLQISARADETLDEACFKIHPSNVGNDGLPQVTAGQVVLDRRSGQPRLVISGNRPINDPIMRLSVDIGCETALRRDLTLLIDPAPAIQAPREVAAETAAPIPIPPITNWPLAPSTVVTADPPSPQGAPAGDGSAAAAPAGARPPAAGSSAGPA